MTTSTVFTNNRTQAVRLPAEVRFPEEVKKVVVRVAGRAGARRSDPPRNLAVIEDFRSRLEMLPYTAKAAMHFGSIRAALEVRGTPIGPMVNPGDLHIAAHARSEGLTLVTNDLREFERVPGLLGENWL